MFRAGYGIADEGTAADPENGALSGLTNLDLLWHHINDISPLGS